MVRDDPVFAMRWSFTPKAFNSLVGVAPKGRNMTAQGNAQGIGPKSQWVALKGRNTFAGHASVSPLQGLISLLEFDPGRRPGL